MQKYSSSIIDIMDCFVSASLNGQVTCMQAQSCFGCICFIDFSRQYCKQTLSI